jgi:FAD:protein FMN transferase
VKSASWPALGTTAVLGVVDAAAFPVARRMLVAELDAVDRACSRFREDSELVALNAASRETKVSLLLFEALQTALRVARITDGLVDPTVGRTLRLAGYDRTFSVLRDHDGTLRPAFVRDPDWRTIELDTQRRTVRVRNGVELDLGSSAKAMAADRAACVIAAATGTGVLVSLGGDVALGGAPPQGGWPIRIAEDHATPLDGEGPVVTVSAGGLATSGTTVRRWSTADGELHHIIDPRTGRPASTFWRTVSVAAASCVDANAASTASIVLGESALAWLGERGLPACLVRYDGEACRVAGWPEDSR